ncbi:MAG: glucuronate isomerase [Nitrososphaerota archaeon]
MNSDIKKIFNEIYQSIEKLEIFDIHNHLNPQALSLSNYEDVIFYHYIKTELASAGVPYKYLEESKGVEKLKIALPYIKYLRNTSTFWSLIKILNDLYGFEDEEINEKNWKKIIDLLESKKNDETWAKNILKNKAYVKKSLLTLNPLEKIPKYDKEIFEGGLRMDSIIPNLNKQNLNHLEKITGIDVRNPTDLIEMLSKLIKIFSDHIVAVTVNIQPDDDFLKLQVNEKEISPYISTLKEIDTLDINGRRILSSFMLNQLLELCKEYNLVSQFMLGVKRPVPGASPPDYAITIFNPQQLMDLAILFAKYPEVNFDIFIADSLLNHPITVIAKNYPNVFLSGYWWYSMYPEIIKSYLKIRLQMLPYNKIGGFFSDAYVADWVYGKAILAKTQIAYVLTEMINEKCISKDLAIDIAKAILCENAERIYKRGI